MKTKGAMLAALSVLALVTACSKEAESDVPIAEANADAPMAKVLAGTDGMDTVARALDDTGLATVFEGAGSYTLLAPSDEAMKGLGTGLADLSSDEGRPAMAELLKAHMVPGYMTPADIAKSLDAASDGKVTVRTFDGEEIVFTRDGEQIHVSGPGGADANIDGEAIKAGASVAIPLDAVLKKV